MFNKFPFIVNKSIKVLIDGFPGKQPFNKRLHEIFSHFDWIETDVTAKPKRAIFDVLYSLENV